MINRNNFTYEEELNNCNFVKLMLMLLVTLYHSSVFWGEKWLDLKPIYSSPILCIFSRWLNSFHIYAFVLVSGYIFYYLKYEKKKYANLSGFIANKIKRLIIPYYTVAIFWVIPINIIIYKGLDLGMIIRSLVGGASQLWFLWMLFWVYIIAWFISDYFYKHNIKSILLVCCFYIVYALCLGKIPNVFQVLNVLLYIPLFLVGFKIRQYSSKFVFKIPVLGWLFIQITLFSIFEKVSAFNGDVEIIKTILKLPLHIVGAIMIFVFLQKLAIRIKWKDNNILKYMSNRSMTIYLFHQQFIYFTIYMLNGRVNPYINMGVNFVIAIGGSLILTNLIFKNNMSKKLIGEKESISILEKNI